MEEGRRICLVGTASPWQLNVASRDAVDEAYGAATTVGAQSIAAPVEREWGGYSAYVAALDRWCRLAAETDR